MASGGPGATDIGDEQKPALIDEDEMSASVSGVFLSAAIPCTSNVRSQPHPAQGRAALASDSSSPTRSAASRRGPGDSESRTLAGSVSRRAAGSRDRSCTPLGAAPSPAAVSAGPSRLGTSQRAGRASPWRPVHVVHRADKPAASERPSSPRREPGAPPPTVSAHLAGAALLHVGASPVARNSRMVACLIASSGDPNILPLFMRDSIGSTG